MYIKIGIPKNIPVSKLQKYQPEGVKINLEIKRDLNTSNYINIFVSLTSTVPLNLFCQWLYNKLRKKNVKYIRINEKEIKLTIKNLENEINYTHKERNFYEKSE